MPNTSNGLFQGIALYIATVLGSGVISGSIEEVKGESSISPNLRHV